MNCQIQHKSIGREKVTWVEGGRHPAENYTSFYGTGNANRHLGTVFFIHKGIVSEDNRVELVSDRMSYIALSGRWCDITVLNVHASTEDTDGTKNSFYKEPERVLEQILKYHMN
jgi:hypothetical protein